MSIATIDEIRQRVESNAKKRGYVLHPDLEILHDLLEGLSVNEVRYGYPSCPCRLATGDFDLDRDIICPCNYRDLDVNEFGACYCTLYLRKDMVESIHDGLRVPERRLLAKQNQINLRENDDIVISKTSARIEASELKLKLWHCKQCGYVVFREDPPNICPICNAKKDKFKKILLQSNFLTT